MLLVYQKLIYEYAYNQIQGDSTMKQYIYKEQIRELGVQNVFPADSSTSFIFLFPEYRNPKPKKIKRKEIIRI